MYFFLKNTEIICLKPSGEAQVEDAEITFQAW